MLLGQKLAMTANQNAAKVAFRYLAKGQTFKEAYSYINRYSYFLQNEIGHNKRVLVYMSNCPHMAYTFFALANTKNVAVFVDPKSAEPKIVDRIKELEISAIIVSDDYVNVVKDMVRNNHLNVPVIQCESRRWGEYDTTYRLPPSISSSDNDVVAIFETAGTTGKPKLVPYNHTMIQQVALVLRAIYRTSSIDNFYTYQASLAHPFYFIHGLVFPFMCGAGVLITDLASPEELAKELMEGKATRLLMKGTVISDWLNSFTALNIKLPLIRSITPEYGPLDPSVEKICKSDYNDVKILKVYGSVETCWAVAARQFEEPEPFDSVGQFLSGVKTRVVDDNGDDIPGNKTQIGQLLVSGPGVATTYLNNKEATKMNIRGAWFFTGDYVEVDKKGVVRYLDRKDNICRVITEIVIPQKVEKVLIAIPGVDKVAVLSVKDQMGKGQLTAVITKRPGIDVTAQQVQEFAKANLPEPQRPKNVAFITEMPIDSHGEINKYRLRYELNAS
jgi:long-chain acyl-CoA synthetase